MLPPFGREHFLILGHSAMAESAKDERGSMSPRLYQGHSALAESAREAESDKQKGLEVRDIINRD